MNTAHPTVKAFIDSYTNGSDTEVSAILAHLEAGNRGALAEHCARYGDDSLEVEVEIDQAIRAARD